MPRRVLPAGVGTRAPTETVPSLCLGPPQATVMAVSSVALGALSLKSGLRDVFNKKN